MKESFIANDLFNFAGLMMCYIKAQQAPSVSLRFYFQRDGNGRKFTNTQIYLLVAPDEPFCAEVGCD